jgi:hypothetical protein
MGFGSIEIKELRQHETLIACSLFTQRLISLVFYNNDSHCLTALGIQP